MMKKIAAAIVVFCSLVSAAVAQTWPPPAIPSNALPFYAQDSNGCYGSNQVSVGGANNLCWPGPAAWTVPDSSLPQNGQTITVWVQDACVNAIPSPNTLTGNGLANFDLWLGVYANPDGTASTPQGPTGILFHQAAPYSQFTGNHQIVSGSMSPTMSHGQCLHFDPPTVYQATMPPAGGTFGTGPFMLGAVFQPNDPSSAHEYQVDYLLKGAWLAQ